MIGKLVAMCIVQGGSVWRVISAKKPSTILDSVVHIMVYIEKDSALFGW